MDGSLQPFVSLSYASHISVEVVNTVEAIKYLYKYVTKGHDKVSSTIQNQFGNAVPALVETENFLQTRYILTSEANWQIYQFPLHSRKPQVEKVSCHLLVYPIFPYEEDKNWRVPHGEPVTKFTNCFKLNER